MDHDLPLAFIQIDVDLSIIGHFSAIKKHIQQSRRLQIESHLREFCEAPAATGSEEVVHLLSKSTASV